MMEEGLSPPRGAFWAGTNFPQVDPRINSEIVIVVPGKTQRIFANLFGGNRFGGRLEHRERAWSKFGRLPRFAFRLLTLLFTQRAGTSIAQEGKAIRGVVAVLPLDLHARTGRHVYRDQLRIVGLARRRVEDGHEFSIACCSAKGDGHGCAGKKLRRRCQ